MGVTQPAKPNEALETWGYLAPRTGDYHLLFGTVTIATIPRGSMAELVKRSQAGELAVELRWP
jgi:hypothetical protein